MQDGLHAHLLLTLTIPDFATLVSLEIRAGAGASPSAPGSVTLNVSRGTILLGRACPSQPDVFPARPSTREPGASVGLALLRGRAHSSRHSSIRAHPIAAVRLST